MSPRIAVLLINAFAEKHVRALLTHYSKMIDSFQAGDWENTIAKSGNLIEAALKALWLHVGRTLPPARQFKAGNIIRDLKQLPTGSFSDAIRITIPRACDFAYDIASNRGARHDPDEVDPNELDANVVVSTSSWVLAELLRYSQKGHISDEETRNLIAGLVERRFPIIEDIDGRTYFHITGLSARQIAILALWRNHPARLTRKQLLEALARHHVSSSNAATALTRITTVIDIDDNGRIRLLSPGVIEAEQIIATASHR